MAWRGVANPSSKVGILGFGKKQAKPLLVNYGISQPRPNVLGVGVLTWYLIQEKVGRGQKAPPVIYTVRRSGSRVGKPASYSTLLAASMSPIPCPCLPITPS